MNTQRTVIEVSSYTFIKFFLIVGLLIVAWAVRDLLTAILVSVVIATPTSGLADKLQKYYVPRGLTALVVILAIIGLLASVVVLFVPVLSSELSNFSNTIPQFQVEIRNFVNGFTRDNGVQDIIGRVTSGDVASASGTFITYVSNLFGASAGAVATFVFQVIIIFVLAFYLAVQEKGVERFLRLVSTNQHEDYIVSLWERSQKKIQSWVNGQLVLALIIGSVVYLGLSVLGVQHALLFGLLAAVCELIPIVGMTIAAVPAVIIAYLSGGVSALLTVGIFYVIVAQTENHILAPMVVSKVVGIPSIIVIISLIAGGMLAGFWGVLLAVPVSAVIMEFVDDIERRKSILHIKI